MVHAHAARSDARPLYHQCCLKRVSAEMTQGERIVLKLQPEYSYAQKGCPFRPPKGYPADADFVFDIQLAAFYPGKDIKVRVPTVVKG